MNFVYDDSPTQKDIDYSRNELVLYNNRYVKNDFEKFAIAVKGKKVIAGIDGVTYWKRAFIHNLWVDENHRNKGIGAELLRRVEVIVEARGCFGIETSTMTFQAESFYEKNGFERFGAIKNFVDGHQSIYFTKEI